MEEIKKGIVFSNDIEYILKGNNALKFSYENNGIMIPNSSFILQLRENFRSDVKKIFNNQVVILTEEEMIYSIFEQIKDVIGRYPHSIIGSNLFNL